MTIDHRLLIAELEKANDENTELCEFIALVMLNFKELVRSRHDLLNHPSPTWKSCDVDTCIRAQVLVLNYEERALRWGGE